MARDIAGNERDMAAAGSDLSVVCPNVMCDGVIALGDAAQGTGVFSCPSCGEAFRLGSDADTTVDLRLTDLDRPGARPQAR